MLKPSIKEKSFVATAIYNPNKDGYSVYPSDYTAYDIYRTKTSCSNNTIFTIIDDIDEFYVLNYVSIDTNIKSVDGKNILEFIAEKKDFIPLDSIDSLERKKILYDITDTMLVLQNHYIKNYYQQRNRYPDSTEYLAYENDVLYYRSVYKTIEHYIGFYAVRDFAFFEKTLRINLFGDYYYNGDSGEGYYTFALLIASQPQWLVAIYKNTKDISLKKNIVDRINSNSQWSYAMGHWYYLFIGVFPELLQPGESPYAPSFKKNLLTKYEKWLIQIDKKWDKNRFL